jgi:branched-chain amino acid transport system substrate-binding protein
MAKALQGFELPPEIALGPNPAIYRAGQNQLMSSLFVGNAQPGGGGAEDLFKVTSVIRAADVAGTVEESGCKMAWPA